MIMLNLRLENLDLTEASAQIAISSCTLPPWLKRILTQSHVILWECLLWRHTCLDTKSGRLTPPSPPPRGPKGQGMIWWRQGRPALRGVFFFWCLVGDVLRAASLRTPNHNSWPSKQVLRISTKLWWSKFQAFPLLPYCSHHHLPVSTHPIRGTSGEVECYSLQA